MEQGEGTTEKDQPKGSGCVIQRDVHSATGVVHAVFILAGDIGCVMADTRAKSPEKEQIWEEKRMGADETK